MQKLRLDQDFQSIRDHFPILKMWVYLISNSLGAVPLQVANDLQSYYRTWTEKGVKAWQEEWWDLARRTGDELAIFLGAGEDEITMMPNATIAHWVALSTQFSERNTSRNKIVMTDHDFPSSMYAVSAIARFMDWEVDLVRSHGRCGINVEDVLIRIDDRTRFVATSHVYFKSGYIQNIAPIAKKAQQVGALSLIDGYHAPGTIPVDLKDLAVDFYVGGCLKWLCGGPGNAFLYVRKDLSSKVTPALTGWFAHRSPFSFSHEMEFTQGAYRFMAGTPSVPSLYTASAGLNIIRRIGISEIRAKSLSQTRLVIDRTRERGFSMFSPDEENLRGGAVSLALPHGYQVRQSLEDQGILIDFRKGEGLEPDTIRVGPHFYTNDDEIDNLFAALDEIYSSGEYKKYPGHIKTVPKKTRPG